MRFRLVTVAILLAIASSGYGRPRDSDPLDGSTQEASSGGNPNSRYMRRSHPPTSYGRRVISITSAKFNRSDRRLIPGLSFESDNSRKNYLPLGALSSSARTTNFFLPLTTPMTIPVGRSFHDPYPSSPKPIPVFMNEGRSFSSRKMDSRTLVRIVPQKLNPGFNSRRNLTSSKFKDSIANLHLKNWPNEAVQSVQDLLNYEKYTSFHDNDKSSVEISKPKITNNRQPSNQKPENSWSRITTTQKPESSWTRITTTPKPESSWTRVPTTRKPGTSWTRVPATETTTLPTTRFEYETTMRIDNLLDDLAKNKRLPQTSSEVMQNTVVHILNAGSKKPNITVIEPSKKVNRTKPGRPPQNVHIMFMVDKDEGNQTVPQGRPATEILGGDSDCPTIMINSITQINNTIESKAGCTDLNIVINSHVLNTNIVKPSASTQNVSPGGNTEGPKNPYVTNYPSTNYQNTYYPNTNYPTASYPNSNYNDGFKDPAALSDSPAASEPEIQTFEVFQGTHINIGGSQGAADFLDDAGVAGGDEALGSDVDGPPLSDTGETSNDIAGTAPEEGAADVPIDGEASASGAGQIGQSSFPAGVANDIGEAQAIEGGAGEANLPSLPSLPNLPNLPRPPSNSLGNTGTQTGTSPAADDEEDEIDELVDAISPVGLLASISNVFTSISVLNPLNYGIFGMAVAPFVAFAAGILGVATFLFPWAFPGYSIPIDIVARAWNDGWSANHSKVRFSPYLRDIVHSSIHKYRHLNEWKGRRRKKKRKR